MGKCVSKSLDESETKDKIRIEDLKSEAVSAEIVHNPINTQNFELIKSTLQNHYLFSGLTSENIERFIQKLAYAVFPAKNNIVTQGQPGSFFFILSSGTAKIVIDGREISTISRGHSFGELALLTDLTRKATVTTIDKCSCWLLNRSTFQEVMEMQAKFSKDSTKDFIETVPIFSAFSESIKNRLAEISVVRTCTSGESIITEGEGAWFVYFIQSGRVEVSIKGKRANILCAGQMFGESALLSHKERRTATVVAVEYTKLLSFSVELLSELLGPNFHEIFMKNSVLNTLRLDEHFKHTESSIIRKISETFTLAEYRKGEIGIDLKLGWEEKVYIVCHGQISIKDHVFKAYSFIGFHNKLSKVFEYENAICDEDTIMACADISDIQNVLGCTIDYFKEVSGKLSFLKSVYQLQNLSNDSLTLLLENHSVENFMKSQSIYLEGERESHIFIIQKGSVGMFISTKILVAKYDRAALFGETCLEFSSRQLSAKALNNVTCYKFDKAIFTRIMIPELEKYIERAAYFENHISLSSLNFSKPLIIKNYSKHVICLQSSSKTKYSAIVIPKISVRSQTEFSLLIDHKVLMISLNHPRIPKLIRTFSDPENVFYIYEYISSDFLADYLKKPFDSNAARFILLSTAVLLNYLHQKKILHRDLSPSSLKFSSDGYIWLTDLTYAKFCERRSFTMLPTSPEYKAKEVLLGRGYSKASDYWSLGVILYEMLYNKSPFGILDNDQPFEAIEKIIKGSVKVNGTSAEEKVLKGMLCDDINKRFQFDEIVMSEWCFEENVEDYLKGLGSPKFVPNRSRIFEFNEEIVQNKHRRQNSASRMNWDSYF